MPTDEFLLTSLCRHIDSVCTMYTHMLLSTVSVSGCNSYWFIVDYYVFYATIPCLLSGDTRQNKAFHTIFYYEYIDFDS